MCVFNVEISIHPLSAQNTEITKAGGRNLKVTTRLTIGLPSIQENSQTEEKFKSCLKNRNFTQIKCQQQIHEMDI